MKLRHWLFFLALVGLAIIIIVNAGQLGSFLHILGSLRWYAVLVIVVLQLFSYYTNAQFYASFFRVFNHKLPLRRLYEATLAVNFVNYILPTAGLAGAGYLTQATHPEVP